MDNVNLTEMNLNDFQKMIAPIEIVLTSQDITSNCESSNYKNISESVKKEIHVKSLRPFNLSNNKNSILKEPIKKKEEIGSNYEVSSLQSLSEYPDNNRKSNIKNYNDKLVKANDFVDFDKFYHQKIKIASVISNKINTKSHNDTQKLNFPKANTKHLKKILSSEEIELERIKKEQEKIMSIKKKNVLTMHRNKNNPNLNICTGSLIYLNSMNGNEIKNPIMLKNKRGVNEGLITSSSELIEKILNKQNVKNIKMLLKEKKNLKLDLTEDFDHDIKEISKNLNNISLSNKTPVSSTPNKSFLRDNIHSPVRFKLLSSNIRNHFKEQVTEDISFKATPIKTSQFKIKFPISSGKSEKITKISLKENKMIKNEKENKKKEIKKILSKNSLTNLK